MDCRVLVHFVLDCRVLVISELNTGELAVMQVHLVRQTVWSITKLKRLKHLQNVRNSF